MLRLDESELHRRYGNKKLTVLWLEQNTREIEKQYKRAITAPVRKLNQIQ